MDWIKACQEFGVIGGLLLLVIFGGMTISFLGFKWILEQFKIELEGNRKERVEYLTILHNIGDKMDAHNERAKENHVASMETHKDMIKILGEQTIAIGRVNGFKH